MLEKHIQSQSKNILGVILCSLLTVFALTNAPTTIAVENNTDNKVSFKFDDIDLKSVIMLVSDANPRVVTGYENVPDIKVSVNAKDVSAHYFEILLLKCSGLKLVGNDNAFIIERESDFDGSIETINQCLQKIQTK